MSNDIGLLFDQMFICFACLCCFHRIIERWYTEDGHCMPPTKPFRQSAFSPPKFLNWEVDISLEKEINGAMLLAQKVEKEYFSINEKLCVC